MHISYVVLYVDNAEACLNFWTTTFGMVNKGSKQAGEFSIVQVGFPDQEFSLELVPKALMANDPNNLDLTTPSMAFRVDELEVTHGELNAKGVTTSEIGNHGGLNSFAFSDNEGRWFAVLEN